MKKILSPAYSLKLKNIILFFNRGLNGHIRKIVSTLPNVVKIDVENDYVVSTLPNVVQFHVEKHNVVSTLQISTLTYTTLFQRWFDVVRRCDVIST